ncbi:hypothetical protein CDL12_17382 [Handroanthus impetiginosus]|uniref:EF-hand domain-containing protein n=1 Tax=Handroanthus impetiginosus TaxID=429701 RepID=A0A2G9GYE9_9LAMI|nr:hypothetical protein CDL12_17382 [Handroanthus impetiginosus]
MNIEEFKKWLKKFEADKDGRITVKALRQAVHAMGGRFCQLKAKLGVKKGDKNFNGVIDDHEICHLVNFAEKHLVIKVVSTY